MRWLDSPAVLGRTPREIALIGIGAFGFVWGLTGAGPFYWQWSIAWAIVTAVFAARAWPARGVAAGACIAAIAQWVCLSQLQSWAWIVNVAVVALALLASRDLVARFDEAPSRVPWLPNPWATMPRADARRLRWSAYAGAVLACVLCQMWCMGARSFPTTPVVFWSIGGIVALLAAGRAAALLPLVGVSGVVAVAQLPGAVGGLPEDAGGTAGAIESIALACATIGLAAPYAWRLVRRTVAGGEAPPLRVRVAGRTRVEVARQEAASGVEEVPPVVSTRERERYDVPWPGANRAQ